MTPLAARSWPGLSIPGSRSVFGLTAGRPVDVRVLVDRPGRSGLHLLRQRPVPRAIGGKGRSGGVQIERRRRDCLGLLPRTADPRQRLVRHRANQALGFALLVFGGTVMGCSLAFVQRGQAAHGALALLLGLVTLVQGVWLVGRQERRGRK